MKAFWKSKTLWVNIFALLGTISSGFYGVKLTPEQIAALLVIVNMILRIITKEEIVWNE